VPDPGERISRFKNCESPQHVKRDPGFAEMGLETQGSAMTEETDRTGGTVATPEAPGTEASPPAAQPDNTGTTFTKKAKDLEAWARLR